MKSTLLKTLAATTLVASSHAAVHVLGTTFKERPVDASTGVIVTNQPAMITTRGYLIIDDTALGTATPTPATYIEYWEERAGNVISRYYTVDTDFTNFRADSIMYNAYSPRLYGFMRVPVQMAEVTNPKISFTGTVFASGFPKSLAFDTTVYQTGASDSIVGPKILIDNPSTLRSTISGNANPVKVSETTIADVTDELIARLTSNPNKTYVRLAGEAPQIVTDLNPTGQVQDGGTLTLSVGLDPDVIPGPDDTFEGPTYVWFKNNAIIPGQTGSSLTVTGAQAATGAGSYKVEVSNEFGSVVSGTMVVTTTPTTFATNLPAAETLTAASSRTLSVVLNPTPITAPAYQWVKGSSSTGPFTPVLASVGGTNPTLTIIGGEGATSGGFYRLEVTTSAGMVPSAVCNVTYNAAAGSNFVFTTNLPRATTALLSGTVTLTPVVANSTGATYKWFKATLANPTVFVELAGSTASSLIVSGSNADPRGPGVYRMTATNAGGTTTIQTIDCVVTTAP